MHNGITEGGSEKLMPLNDNVENEISRNDMVFAELSRSIPDYEVLLEE